MTSSTKRQSALWQIALTLVIGAVGVVLGRMLHIPGGAVTGAMLGTAIVRVLGAPLEQSPEWARSGARSMLGLAIGATVTVETVQTVARAFVPIMLMLLALTGLSLGTAYAINRLTRMPLPTALCGSAPGALAAMVTAAEDLGGNAPVVASMHMVRLVSVMLVVPSLVQAWFGNAETTAPIVAEVGQAAPAVWRLGLLLLLGIGAGFLARRYRLPAGELLAGLLVAALLNPLILHVPNVPNSWRLFAQWVIGAGVGATLTRETLRDFRPFALAGALMTVFLILSGLLLGWLLYITTPLDMVTCIMGSAPGGADTMIILAGELNADVQLVAAMHVSRMIILMLLLPVLVRTAASGELLPLRHIRRWLRIRPPDSALHGD